MVVSEDPPGTPPGRSGERVPVTIRDVAARAGVSVGTVSNVLNRPSYVSPDVLARVRAAIADLEFVPTKSRQRFPAGRERVFGCVVVDLGHPFFTDVVLAAEEEATGLGAAMVICHSGEDVGREARNLGTLIQLRVHGIIVAPVADRTPHIEELRSRGVPLVYLDRLDPMERISSVLVDHRKGGGLAAAHLIELGHRKFAFVGMREDVSVVRDRLEGFRERICKTDLDTNRIDLIRTDDWTSQTAGESAAREFLRTSVNERATGVFCATDMLARGFVAACRRAGVRVPGDVSVIGYDDLDQAPDVELRLTSVRQPREELGREAIRLLSRVIDDGDATSHRVVLQPQLQVRDTAAPPPQ